MTLAGWLKQFGEVHARARAGKLSDPEREVYIAEREALARLLVKAQQLTLKQGERMREAVRIARALALEIGLPGGWISSLTLDISTGGFSTLMAEVVPVGSALPFRLKLPRGLAPIVGTFKVVNVVDRVGSARVSAMFLSLPPEDRSRLQLVMFDFVLAALAD